MHEQEPVSKEVIKKSFKEIISSANISHDRATDGDPSKEYSSVSESSEEPADVYKYSEFVPSGDHYFYFVNRNNEYCLSQKYEVVNFPGTSLRMNRINVEESQAGDMNLVRYK